MKIHSVSTILVLGLLVFQTGCNKVQFSALDTSTTTTGTTTGTTSGTTTSTTTTTTTTTTTASACSTTATVPLTVASVATLSNYAQVSLSNPLNITTTINMSNTGDGHYYGNVQISYIDNGVSHNGVFNAPAGNNVSIDTLYDNGTLTSAFNYWYNNSTNFSAFTQDPYGAVVLTVNSVDSSGCATGKLYYKNFNITPITNVQSGFRKCWFIYSGPYACRADNIINKSSLIPDGYTYLGSFTGLPVSQAFQ